MPVQAQEFSLMLRLSGLGLEHGTLPSSTLEILIRMDQEE
jgi:hypothetical protein